MERKIKLLQVNMQVQLIVEIDGVPKEVITSQPISIFAHAWPEFKLPLAEMIAQAESQLPPMPPVKDCFDAPDPDPEPAAG